MQRQRVSRFKKPLNERERGGEVPRREENGANRVTLPQFLDFNQQLSTCIYPCLESTTFQIIIMTDIIILNVLYPRWQKWDVLGAGSVCRSESNNLALIDLQSEREGEGCNILMWHFLPVSSTFQSFLAVSRIFYLLLSSTFNQFLSIDLQREGEWVGGAYLCGKLECATHSYSKQSQKLQIWPLFTCCMQFFCSLMSPLIILGFRIVIHAYIFVKIQFLLPW